MANPPAARGGARSAKPGGKARRLKMPPEGLGPFSAGVVNLALGVGAANMYSDLTSGDKPIMEISLADTTVYGFSPENSQKTVTFADSVDFEGSAVVSQFNTGDTLFVRTVDSGGEAMEHLTITISYVPPNGQPGAVLRTWNF